MNSAWKHTKSWMQYTQEMYVWYYRVAQEYVSASLYWMYWIGLPLGAGKKKKNLTIPTYE